MAFKFDAARQAATERFRAMAMRFEEIALEVEKASQEFDDSGAACTSCGSTHYNNWPQRQLRARVNGAAERLREIGSELKRRATDEDFLGIESPETARRALQNLNDNFGTYTLGGEVVVSAETWVLINQALGKDVTPWTKS